MANISDMLELIMQSSENHSQKIKLMEMIELTFAEYKHASARMFSV